MQVLPINKIISNPNNPRLVNKAKFEKLKQSIKDFPQMLELRPIVINEDGVILGGNMRYKALVELGHETVNVIVASYITKEQEQEFIVKDNLSFGDWDYDVLANEWDSVELDDWGLDVWQNLDDVFANLDEEPNEELKKLAEDNKIVCALCGK